MSFVDLYSIKSCYLRIPLYHVTSGPYTPPLTPCKKFSLKRVKPFSCHTCLHVSKQKFFYMSNEPKLLKL